MKGLFPAFWMVLKRGWNNWKLEANLLAILTVAVSIIACIPIFTDGSLQFGLTKSLDEYEKNSGIPAGVIIMSCSTKENDITAAVHSEVTEFLRKEAPVLIDLDLIRHQFHGVLDRKFKRPTSAKFRYGRMMFLSNFADMINIIDGRIPEDNANDEIEVMVSEKCFNDFELLKENNYPFEISEDITFTVKVVGVFKLKDKYRGSHELAINNNGVSISLRLRPYIVVLRFPPADVLHPASVRYGLDKHGVFEKAKEELATMR